jgi:hypothetical protein
MKKQAFMILMTLSLFITLSAVSVYAQSDMRLTVNIPFEFSVRNKVLAAGEYTITQRGQNSLLIRRVDHTASDVFLTSPTPAGTTPNESILVFNRYGDQYFLSKVWTSGNDTGHELGKRRAEQKLVRARIKSAYSASSERQIVSILAHR